MKALVAKHPIDVTEIDNQFKFVFDELYEIGSKNLDSDANHTMILKMKRIVERLDHLMMDAIIHFYLTGEKNEYLYLTVFNRSRTILNSRCLFF